MNKSKLKSYAPAARRDFITAVKGKAALLGLSAERFSPIQEQGDYAIIEGRPHPRKVAAQRKRLEARIQKEGFDQVVESVAYTWFNRLLALRYMELHGYLSHGYRVLSHPQGGPFPEILEKAAQLELPGLNKQKVIDLKLAGDQDAELYRLLLVAQCNALAAAMPFLFERIDDETELLLPDNLLHSDSVVKKLVTEVDEEDWQEVEVIGWLYQFYISEKKDQVIGKVVKSEDIPAATQLFTPNWIVKYLLENSLGRKWLLTYPNSPLKERMEYYIPPAEQEPEVLAELVKLIPDSLDPEELTVLDPACGSGHILVEAYELLREIYLERGYPRREIPKLILEKNLFGLDIDDRAAQMAGFALLMKAAADNRRIMEETPKLNVLSIQDSNHLSHTELLDSLFFEQTHRLVDSDRLFETTGRVPLAVNTKQEATRQDVQLLLDTFRHGKTFGSLIQIDKELAGKLPALKQLIEANLKSNNAFAQHAGEQLMPFVLQAEILAHQYDAVVANPPYMGSGYFASTLKDYIGRKFPNAKADVYACFMLSGVNLVKHNGMLAMITIPGWMTLSSFENLRQSVLGLMDIEVLVHNGRGVFGSDFGSCSFIFRKSQALGFKGTYKKLSDKSSDVSDNEVLAQRLKLYPRYHSAKSDFYLMPGTTISFWASKGIRESFRAGQALKAIGDTRQGMATSDNGRFLRYWAEVASSNIKLNCNDHQDAKLANQRWFPYNKGGAFRKWYGNQDMVINWKNGGEEVIGYAASLYGSPTRTIKSMSEYFKECVSWSKVSIGEIAFRYFPSGFMFDVAGCSIFFKEKQHLLAIIALLNSRVGKATFRVLSPTLNYETGHVASFPVLPTVLSLQAIKQNTELLIGLSKKDWDSYETSWDFSAFPWLAAPLKASAIASSWEAWSSHCAVQMVNMKELEEENNRLFIEAYGLQDELTPEVPEEEITLARADRETDVKRLLSYAVGCMMGRYSLDVPGLVYAHAGNEGFDASKYNTFPADDDGILPVSDEDWFHEDATNRFIEFVRKAWPEDKLGENLAWVAESLGGKAGEVPVEVIRKYFSSKFYKDHLSTYKKRPIYWLFSSGREKAFEALVYLHRYNENTLARMRQSYVIPLMGKLAATLDHLEKDLAAASSTSSRTKLNKAIEKLKKKQFELASFDELLRHHAEQHIKLDLDDGVRANYAKLAPLLGEAKAICKEAE